MARHAVLHALGVTRGQQLALVLAGSAIIGTFGAVLGVMLGIAAAAAGLPIAWRVWAGARTRNFAEALLVPPLLA